MLFWLLLTRHRRIVTAVVLAELGGFFAIALRDPMSVTWFCLSGAVLLAVPMTHRWRRAEARRLDAALADQLAAAGAHEAAARLRTLMNP